VYGSAATAPDRHNLKTGNQIPVEIMAEVDRKIDDGRPLGGAFQFSIFASNGTAPQAAGGAEPCISTNSPADSQWEVTTGVTNCGGASIF
jgi:hypothetical protein